GRCPARNGSLTRSSATVTDSFSPAQLPAPTTSSRPRSPACSLLETYGRARPSGALPPWAKGHGRFSSSTLISHDAQSVSKSRSGTTRSRLTQAKVRAKGHDRDCPRLVGIRGTGFAGENATPPSRKGRPSQRKKVRAMDEATTRLTV